LTPHGGVPYTADLIAATFFGGRGLAG